MFVVVEHRVRVTERRLDVHVLIVRRHVDPRRAAREAGMRRRIPLHRRPRVVA